MAHSRPLVRFDLTRLVFRINVSLVNPDLAEACGLMRLLDTRFAGIARGVGTAKILGRVHSAQIKLADLHLPCSFTIMEVGCSSISLGVHDVNSALKGRDVDLLLGLDMLKAHQACIDLEKGVLRIQGREVRFLSEHELPEKARDPIEPPADQPAPAGPSTTTSNPPRAPAFPGGGNTLGSAPAARAAQRTQQHPEDKIRLLMDLGATREIAISSLDAAGGNVDVAASLLF